MEEGTTVLGRTRNGRRPAPVRHERTGQWMTLEGTELVLTHPPNTIQPCAISGRISTFTGRNCSDIKNNFRRHLRGVHKLTVDGYRNVCGKCEAVMGAKTSDHICPSQLSASAPFPFVCDMCERGFTVKMPSLITTRPAVATGTRLCLQLPLCLTLHRHP